MTGSWEAVFFVGCGLNAVAALMAWFVLKPMRKKFMDEAVEPAGNPASASRGVTLDGMPLSLNKQS